MRLAKISVSNFRRIREVTCDFAPTTFIIGPNNVGKSTLIRAIELLLSEKTPEPPDFFVPLDGEPAKKITIIGEFTGIDPETAMSPGFKGRVVDNKFKYKRTYEAGAKKPQISCLEYKYVIKPQYNACKTYRDLTDQNVDVSRLAEKGTTVDLASKLKHHWERDFLDVVVDFDESSADWFDNPGGIPQNVQKRLPLVVAIPALTEVQQLGQANERQKTTVIGQVLQILFQELIRGSSIARDLEAQLQMLEAEMRQPGAVLDTLSRDVSSIIANVFPDCGIRVNASLSAITEVLRPDYTVSMFSNTRTDVSRQGTGLLRATLFSMLRHHARMKKERNIESRPLLFAFEEPELYLHPAAGNLLRDTVYELGESDQIVCTTHSPWMIDLSRNHQSLTKMSVGSDGEVTSVSYGLSEKALMLAKSDRARVDLIQLFDDELSRAFFCDEVVIVEGDSEFIAIKQALRLLPPDTFRRLAARTQIVKARGKATIPPLVSYLKAFSIPIAVMHDLDNNKHGADSINNKIATLLDTPERLVILDDCLETVLGYKPPADDKPFRVYQETRKWTTWDLIPPLWRHHLAQLFKLDMKIEVPPSPRKESRQVPLFGDRSKLI